MSDAPDSPDQPDGTTRSWTRRRWLELGLGVVLAAAIGICLAIALSDSEPESITAETAEAGQCIDLSETAGRVDITMASCTASHDAEIVLVTDFGEAIAEPADLADAEGICTGLMPSEDLATLEDHGVDLEFGSLIDEPSNVDGFDQLVCYVRPVEGSLDGPILDSA